MHAFEMGWHELQNGELLAAAESSGFAIFITADRNLRYQNRMAGRRIAVVELSTNHWATLERHADRVLGALTGLAAGGYVAVAFPRPPLRRRPAPTIE